MIWGDSSTGRALGWQPRGWEFDPPSFHPLFSLMTRGMIRMGKDRDDVSLIIFEDGAVKDKIFVNAKMLSRVRCSLSFWMKMMREVRMELTRDVE